MTLSLSSNHLPKDYIGHYSGIAPAYSMIKDDVEFYVEEQEVNIVITEKGLIYSSGKMELVGTYIVINQEDGNYLLNANISNGKSVNYALEMVLGRKGKTVMIQGKNGEPDVYLNKIKS